MYHLFGIQYPSAWITYMFVVGRLVINLLTKLVFTIDDIRYMLLFVQMYSENVNLGK